MTALRRSVTARWTGGLRAEVDAGGFPLVADEPEAFGGTGLLLASIASCFTLAVAHSAARRGVTLTDLRVEVTGSYDGPRFTAFRIVVHTDVAPGAELDAVIAAARRVCYVTRTLADPPEIDVVLG
jgi:putative redox protein